MEGTMTTILMIITCVPGGAALSTRGDPDRQSGQEGDGSPTQNTCHFIWLCHLTGFQSWTNCSPLRVLFLPCELEILPITTLE